MSKSLVIVSVLVFGIIAAVFLTQQRHNILNFARTPTVILNIVPNSIYLEKDQTTTIQIIINTQDFAIDKTEVHLIYTPELISIENVKIGNFLPHFIDNNIENGQVTLSFLTDVPKKGIGILAELKIRAVVKGTSKISFSPLTKISSNGNVATIKTYGVTIVDDPKSVENSISNIPQGVVYIDPSSYIKMLIENPKASPVTVNQKIEPGFTPEYAKYLLSLPFQAIQKLNNSLEEKTSKIINK